MPTELINLISVASAGVDATLRDPLAKTISALKTAFRMMAPPFVNGFLAFAVVNQYPPHAQS